MNVSVSLTPELVAFIKDKVDTGDYASTSDVIRKALLLLEQAERDEDTDRARLRQAWAEGIASGDTELLDFTELKAAARRRLAGSGTK